MKRSPMPQRRAPLVASAPNPATPRSPITRRVTDRLRASGRLLAAVRPVVFERDGYLCAWCGSPDCLPLITNHRHPRGRGGSSRNPAIHSPANLILMGQPCHELIETTGARTHATDRGFFVPTGMSAERCPVWYPDGWWLLSPEGTRRRVSVTYSSEDEPL